MREGASIQVDAANAYAVRMGGTDSSGNVVRVAEIGGDGYRRHIVTLNGALSGGRGIFLAGGGKVFIGAKGTIDSTFGLPIYATGNIPGDPVIKPKLLVDMNLDGRRVVDVIGEGLIVNSGETTIVVNDVELHDGADGVVLQDDGVTPVSVPNGARDVSIRLDGFIATGRNSDGWTFTERAENTIISRDFLAADFIDPPASTCPEGQTGTPPNCVPPPTCPEGQVGTPPNCTTPPPPPPLCPPGQVGTPPDCMTSPKRVFDGSGSAVGVFHKGGGRVVKYVFGGLVVKYVFGGLVDAAADFLTASGQVAGEPVAGVIETPGSSNLHEVYAPRSAVYEALPGFLLAPRTAGGLKGSDYARPARRCGRSSPAAGARTSQSARASARNTTSTASRRKSGWTSEWASISPVRYRRAT